MNKQTALQMRIAASSGATLPELMGTFNLPAMTIIMACFNNRGDHFLVPDKLLSKRLRNGKSIIGEDCIEKLCPACREYYPLTEEFWGKRGEAQDGTQPYCRACTSERDYLKRNGMPVEIRSLRYLPESYH